MDRSNNLAKAKSTISALRDPVTTAGQAAKLLDAWIANFKKLAPMTIQKRLARAAAIHSGTAKRASTKGSAYAATASLQTLLAKTYARWATKGATIAKAVEKDTAIADSILCDVKLCVQLQNAILSGDFWRRTPLRKKAAKLPDDAFIRVLEESEKREAGMRRRKRAAQADKERERRRGFLAQVLSGARPSELKKTITVQIPSFVDLDVGGNKVKHLEVRASVNGAKCRELGDHSHGQPERAVGVAVSDPGLIKLIQRTFAEGFNMIHSAEDSRAVAEWLARRAKQAGLNGPRMSPYDARNRFASNLKSSGRTKREVAAAMGHAVTATAGYYGYASRGKGGFKIYQAEPTRKVRETHRERDVSYAKKESPPTIGRKSRDIR